MRQTCDIVVVGVGMQVAERLWQRRLMVTYDLTLTLPDHLAQEADNAGLLTPEAIERLLRDEVRRRAVKKLFTAADQLAGVEFPPLTEREVEAEIAAVRASKNASGATRC